MIIKKTFGNPFPTEAVTGSVPEFGGSFEEGFSCFLEFDGTNTFRINLDEKDIVYGLGETVRGINKRGWRYVNYNKDNPHHQEDTLSLYGSHNFVIISGPDKCYGLFFDYAGKIEFDIGYTRRDLMEIKCASADLVLYAFTSDTELDIVHEFRSIIGKSYIAPKWGLGYGQSRWGYMNEADIREVADTYRKLDIPLDSIYMDIDYMDAYKDFTVDKNRFPDLAKLSSDLKETGIHLVPIIDAGVKIEEGYDVYEEGVDGSYFCKDKDGKDFVGAVWPGRVHFPDFLKPEAREWFGMKYKRLIDMGIDGFWNDMNEPAIFYAEDSLNDVLEHAASLKGTNVGIREYFGFTDKVAALNGNSSEYDKFYHDIDGKLVKHSEVHNLYGMNMTRSAFEAFKKINPNEQPLFFSRSSYVGAHRYGGIWQGDNKSWWSHILMGLSQLPGLNMAGFLFIGSDVGGFGSDTTEDLMLRWLQFAMFTPLMRNHSADGTRRQELYQFSNCDSLRKMIRVRYAILKQLWNIYVDACENDKMMFKPLGFEFRSDEFALEVEDQLLLGDNMMIAPVYKANATGRYVYLPEEMMLVRMKDAGDYTTEVLPQGHHYVSIAMDEASFFIRKGKPVEVLTDMDGIKSSSEVFGREHKVIEFT